VSSASFPPRAWLPRLNTTIHIPEYECQANSALPSQGADFSGRGCPASSGTPPSQHRRAPLLPTRNVYFDLGKTWYVARPIPNFHRSLEPTVKLEDGAQHKNLRIFSASTGEELISFSQKSQEGWDLQYTISESHAIRLVSNDIQVFHPADWSKGIADKLKVEGATSISLSPGLNPSVAVFVGEKKVCQPLLLIVGSKNNAT
jgi:hypothetical protein